MATFDKRGEIEVNGKKMFRYRLRVSNGFDKNGKRTYISRTITASSDSAAKKQLALLVSDLERGQAARSNSTMSFAEFSEKWERDYASTHLSPKTLQEWTKRLEKRILPQLGSTKLSQLKTANIDKFISDLSKSERQDQKAGGLSPRTVKDYFNQVKVMLQIAVKWDLIAQNPCDRATPPRLRKHAPNALDEQDLPQLLAALQKEDALHQAMILLSLGTGIRQGELMGLEWIHIDFEKETLSIMQAAQYVKGQGSIIKPPKTDSSVRTLSIPQFALSALSTWQEEQGHCRELLENKWVESGRVFTSRLGTPLKADYCSSWWPKFRKRAQLPNNVTFHGLRHSSASLLLAQGLSIADVSKRLGHSTVNTTAAIYLHGQSSSDSIAATKMDQLIRSIPKRP